MTLAGGTRLGPYEILTPLGQGGMGEVYRARDTRLERTVAVKVLPSQMSASAETRQRFEREAKRSRSFPIPASAGLPEELSPITLVKNWTQELERKK